MGLYDGSYFFCAFVFYILTAVKPEHFDHGVSLGWSALFVKLGRNFFDGEIF